MPSAVDILKRIDWKLVENDVVDRIRLLAGVSGSLTGGGPEADPTHEMIARDLIIPALNVLFRFRECVRVEIPPDHTADN